MNAAQHVNYMMALCRLTSRLNSVDGWNYTGFIRRMRRLHLIERTSALIEFDRRITT